VLYTLVSAVVLIVCLGLAVYAIVPRGTDNAKDRAATRFRVIDELTTNRVYRPLYVVYEIAGSGDGQKRKNLFEHDEGQFQLEGKPESINIVKVQCPGHSFVRRGENHQDNVIDLVLRRVLEGTEDVD